VEASNKRWTVLSSGVCDAGRIDFTALLDSPADAEIEGLTEYFEVSSGPATNRAWRNDDRGQWPLSKVWAKASTGVVIPYDLGRRKERFRQAYEAMPAMIEYYEKARERRKQ
jgi:hypothetical protein